MPDADPDREGLPAHVLLLSAVPELMGSGAAETSSDELGSGLPHPLEGAIAGARLPIHRTDPVA